MKSILVMFLVILAFIGGFVFDGLITRVPLDASTCGRMMQLKRDIADFYAQNGALPESLDALETSDVKADSKKNAWGGPISYSISNETTVVLKTYGPGGAEAEVKQAFTLIFNVNEK